MNQNRWFTLTSTLNMFIVILLKLFFTRKASCTPDPMYLACKEPKTCGNGTEISYPFYIKEQDPSCGYAGFELTCNSKGHPILKISENNYVVQNIFYDNQTLRLLNDGWFGSNGADSDCIRPIRNMSLSEEGFEFVGSVGKLSLFYNCSSTLVLTDHVSNYYRETVDCSSVLAVAEHDPNMDYVTMYCNNLVMAPVNPYEDGNNYDISEVITRGFDLKWTAVDCSHCVQSGGRCGFKYTTYQFICFCRDRPHAWSCPAPGKSQMKFAIAAAAIAILVLVVLCGFLIRLFRNRNSASCSDIERLIEENDLSPKRFSYSEIKLITNDFQDELGKGAFGLVYRGKLQNGQIVAVKVLNNQKCGNQDFINEVASISRTSHINIVGFKGFCFQEKKRALIFEFMPNGSLDKFIYNNSVNNASCRQLDWKILYQISLGIAKGLEYLHRGCKTRIVHFDIKPHNILLDEDFSPKISDFGLAKLCPEKKSILSMKGPRGTPGYIAPEMFLRNLGKISHKSDVYSYGMMVLEMVGGRKNLVVEQDHASEIYFPLWIYNRLETSNNELGLQGIGNNEENQFARKMIIVSLWCIQTNPSTRPSISEVVDMLEGNVESLSIPPNPHLSSSPTKIS